MLVFWACGPNPKQYLQRYEIPGQSEGLRITLFAPLFPLNKLTGRREVKRSRRSTAVKERNVANFSADLDHGSRPKYGLDARVCCDSITFRSASAEVDSDHNTNSTAETDGQAYVVVVIHINMRQ